MTPRACGRVVEMDDKPSDTCGERNPIFAEVSCCLDRGHGGMHEGSGGIVTHAMWCDIGKCVELRPGAEPRIVDSP